MCVCDAVWEIPALAVVENAWNAWTSVEVLGVSYEVLAVGLSDFGGQTQWSWRTFPALVITFLDSKFHWRSCEVPIHAVSS